MIPEDLPNAMKKRLKALKNLQAKFDHQQTEFFEEMHKLYCKYHIIFQGFHDKRSDIVNGKVEPTDEECVWPVDGEDPFCDEFKAIALNKKQIKGIADVEKIDESVKGIPEFWVTVFKNSNLLKRNAENHDWPILKHLQDIKLIMNEDEHRFRLDFEFEDNDFFTNKVISKTYFMRFQAIEKDPRVYDGHEVFKCEGSQIHWKPGKNATVRIIKKVRKQGGKKTVTTGTYPIKSFFNFFQPPLVKDGEKINKGKMKKLKEHFEIGEFFKQNVISLAVLFYTGEYVEDDDEEDDWDKEFAKLINVVCSRLS